jgi:CRP-like cAMP-binding protein
MDPARLMDLPLFAKLDDEERADVAACAREVTVEPGGGVTVEGAHAYELFVIESGEADVIKDGEVIRSLGPGDAFGEIGLLATGTRTATIIATTPMKLVAIFSREFKSLEARMPTLGEHLRALMRENVARTSSEAPRGSWGPTAVTGDGASRIRTGDLVGASDALSQLSYGPVRANGRRSTGTDRRRVVGLDAQGPLRLRRAIGLRRHGEFRRDWRRQDAAELHPRGPPGRAVPAATPP